MKRSDYTLMSLVVMVAVLAMTFPVHAEEPLIAAMREHSQKIMPFSCTIEVHPITHPMFSDAEEAIKYETNRLREREKQLGKKMEPAVFEQVLQSNVKYYLEGSMSDYVTQWSFKCLDMNTVWVMVYDTIKQTCMQMQLFNPSFMADYFPNDHTLTILPRTDETRATIPFLYHEVIYQLDNRTVNIESQDNQVVLEAARNPYDLYTFVFSPGRPFIPEKITRNTLAWHSEHEYRDFQLYNGFTVPHTIFFQQYNLHPVTSADWLKYEITYKVTEFKVEDNLSEKDLDIVIPAGTRIFNGFTNTSYTGPEGMEGQSTTVRAIAEDMLKKQ